MDANITIRAENLTKIYKLYSNKADRVRETFHPFKKRYHQPFHALSNINFQVHRGDTLGIIGRNGSGKSTLLQIVCGIIQPTSGRVQVNGKISALLELGAGFNPEFSGLENIYLNGAILGYSHEEMDDRVDNIMAFADIGEFIHQPVKTYSSGMYVRLAFSVATEINPDILVIDEALSVGDMFFQAKSMHRMKNMIENEGTTLLFVSHDIGSVKSICKQALFLDKGEACAFGKADEVAEKYFSMMVKDCQQVIKTCSDIDNDDEKAEDLKQTAMLKKVLSLFNDNKEFKRRAMYQRIRNGKAHFANVKLLDENETEIQSIEYGQRVILRMALSIEEDINNVAFGYHIRDRDGVDVIYSDSVIENFDLFTFKKDEKYIIDWQFRICLQHGLYNIAVVLSIVIDLEISKVDFCDFVPICIQFEMNHKKPTPLFGKVYWPNNVKIDKLIV